MDLKIKPEYLEYSIGGGTNLIIKLKNMPIYLYQFYYDNGYAYMFDILDNNMEDINDEYFNEEIKQDNDFNK